MRQKEIIGAFVKIPIDENTHTYGRIIKNHTYAFYDFKTSVEVTNLEEIEKSKVLFKLMVHISAITKTHWKIIARKGFTSMN